MMKKILVSAFIFIFLGIKAQIAPIEFPSGSLTEESIAKILDNSRKKGIKEFEIQIQSNRLHKLMQQQQSGLFSAGNQKGFTPPPQVNSSGCTNPGFENGNTNGWTFEAGDNSSSTNLPCPSCFGASYTVIDQVVNSTSNATVNNPAANCSISNTRPCTNGVDNYGSFPVVPPGGGNYSLLLNNTCAGYKMQQAQYTFVVNSSNDVFIFQYAAVLQDGGHPLNESPYFDVATTDLTTGTQPACAQYSAVASSGNLNGWTSSTTSAGTSAGGVSFKPWTTVSLDLQSAIGHTVTVKFTVSDCNQGGHFGYCYIDAQCSNPTSASGVVGTCGTTGGQVTLSAPPGFATYQWYGPSPNTGTAIAGATSQTLTTSASINDTFVVKTTSAAGCPSSFNIVVGGSVITAVTTSTATCKGGSGGAVAIATGGSGTYQYNWTGPSGPIGTNTTTALNSLPAGTYSVSIVDNIAHCPTKDTTITVLAINPTLQTSTAQLCGTQTTLHAPNSYTNTTYTWYDASDVITSVTTQTYAVSNVSNGQHYIVTYLDSASHCEDSLKISLTVTNISFNPSPLPSCPSGNTGSITYYPNSGNNFTSFDWVCSSGASGTNAASPVQIGSLASGVYTTTLSIPGNASCQEIITSTVGVTSNTVVPVTTNTVTACNLDNVVINPSVPNSTHSWSGPGVTYPTTTATLVLSTPFTNTTTAYYTYVDTITTTGAGGCSSRSVYKEIISLKSFKVSTSIIEHIKCYGDATGKIKATVTSEVNGPISTPDKYTFSWSPGTFTTTATGLPSTSIIPNLSAGTYMCMVTNGNCVNTVTVTLVDGVKTVGDTMYAYYCPKDSLALIIADTNGNTNIKWHPDRLVLHDTITVSVTGDSAKVITQYLPYVYITYKHNGCPDTARTIISTTTYDAFRPNELVNVFSPNGDKTNDFFYPFHQQGYNQYQIYKQQDTYELHIYDRWGKSVYDATEYNKPWDGKTKSGHDADAGTYFFIVKYKSNCGSKADLVENKGFLELVR